MIAEAVQTIQWLTALMGMMAGGGGVVAERIMTQAVEAVSSSEQGTVVVTPGLVSVLDSEGRRVRTVPTAPAHRARRRPLKMDGGGSTPGLPADADWARGYDLEEMDDDDDPRLADETASDAESTARDGPSPTGIYAPYGSPATAAGGRFAWVGLPGGLWRIDVDDGALERERTGDVRTVASSPDGQTVAFVQNHRLYRSRDGGRTFTDDVPFSMTVRQVVAANTGTVVSIDGLDSTVRVFDPTGGEVKDLGRALATSVASCGDAVVILSAGTIRMVRTATTALSTMPAAIAAPLGTDQVACDARGRLLVAIGPELRWTADAGQSWSVIDGRPPGALTGLAVTESAIWIGASSGLWRIANPLRRQDGRRRRLSSRGDCARSIGTVPGFTRGPAGASAWWPSLLPRVDLMAATAGLGHRREVRGLVLLTFAIGGSRLRERTRDHATDLNRHGEQRASSVDACAAASATDPIVVEENAALAQALKESP